MNEVLNPFFFGLFLHVCLASSLTQVALKRKKCSKALRHDCAQTKHKAGYHVALFHLRTALRIYFVYWKTFFHVPLIKSEGVATMSSAS